jgi:hypothetical protein
MRGIQTGSGAMTFIPSFIKTGSVDGGYTDMDNMDCFLRKLYGVRKRNGKPKYEKKVREWGCRRKPTYARF